MTVPLSLLDIVNRTNPPAPWAEGDNIPWDNPAFSERMLQEHLSQQHDLASRRAETIDRHVRWIHERLLSGRPVRILDLGCGPGLYTSRLAGLGHTCVGIDFSPASIDHARRQAEASALPCTYLQDDLRSAELGRGFGLTMMIFGQFNVFRRREARDILLRTHAALVPGGYILLEPQSHASVRRDGATHATWGSATGGLFSARPHLVLHECFWDEAAQASTERWHVIDAETGRVNRYALSNEAYTEGQLAELLRETGFRDVRFAPSLTGEPDESKHASPVVFAQR